MILFRSVTKASIKDTAITKVILVERINKKPNKYRVTSQGYSNRKEYKTLKMAFREYAVRSFINFSVYKDLENFNFKDYENLDSADSGNH